jgi:hypothetical protein
MRDWRNPKNYNDELMMSRDLTEIQTVIRTLQNEKTISSTGDASPFVSINQCSCDGPVGEKSRAAGVA